MGASVLDSAADTNYDLITRDSAAEVHGDKKVIQLDGWPLPDQDKSLVIRCRYLPEFALFVYRSVSGVDTLEWIAGASGPRPYGHRYKRSAWHRGYGQHSDHRV